MTDPVLIDQFGRKHDYLRISLTDKCNLRCTYCMPEGGMHFKPNKSLMTTGEVIAIAETFVRLGVKKIRLTGGEPLVRQDAGEIIEAIGALPVLLSITSNGLLIDRFFDRFRASRIDTINISLDSLREDRFEMVTRRNYLQRVMANINRALQEGFRVKVNSVMLKGVNEEELLDFVEWTMDTPVDMRFIEYMPFNSNGWEFDKVVSYDDMMSLISSRYEVEMLTTDAHSTSRNFRIKGAKGTLGIISSVTRPFCDGCNRIRITADGKLKNCLFSTEESDILAKLRKNEDILPVIARAIHGKHFSRGGLKGFEIEGAKEDYNRNRSMIAIGG